MQGTHPMGIMINALEYAKRLRNAGVDGDLAEAQAEALSDVLNNATETHLATKTDVALLKEDLNAVEKRLDQKIDHVETRLDHKIDQLEIRLTNKMFMMSASIITLLGGLMTVLHFY